MKLIHVGLGNWGTNWEETALPHVPEVERVAVVEAFPEALALAQSRLELPDDACFTTLDDALAAHPADIVLVTTPIAAHVPVALQALEAGCHVLVEKPFAESLEQGQRAIDAADRAGRLLMVSQNYRFYPAARTAARVNREGEMGEAGNVHVDFRRWANDAPYASNHHYRFPNPLLADMAIHHWDLMRMVLGVEAVEVYAKTHSPVWSKFDQPAEATALVTFENGQVLTYRGSWVSSGEPTDWSGEWRHEYADGEVTWTGRAGVPEGALTDQVRIHRRGTRPMELPLDELPSLGRSAALHHLVGCIATGSEPESSGRRNLGTLALMDAALRSATSGRTEAVQSARMTRGGTWPTVG